MHPVTVLLAFLLLMSLLVHAGHVRAVRRRAERDDMTGVLRYQPWLRRASARLSPAGALLMLDVDDFSAINARHGHPYGSQVLASLAQALSAAVARNGIVGRYGGDEFVVLLYRADDLATTLTRLGAAPAVSIYIPGDDSPAAYASLGVAVATAKDGIQSLLERADAELYAAKPPRRQSSAFAQRRGHLIGVETP